MQIVKNVILGVMFLATLLLSITSCSEQDEIGEYDNWEARNLTYLDSIAQVCNKNADGKWFKLCAYTLNDSVESLSPNKIHYVYCHKIEDGTGTYHPLYNDSIRVHYLGRLIPSSKHSEGYIFGKSYSTYTFNPLTDVPSLMAVSQNVVGFATATMHMVQGDRWMLYIPYYLGYGESESSSSSIPGYSTLIFDVQLAKIYKYQIDKDTSWH